MESKGFASLTGASCQADISFFGCQNEPSQSLSPAIFFYSLICSEYIFWSFHCFKEDTVLSQP